MFTAVLDVPGGQAFELTPIADSVRYETSVPGGFGGASFRVAGIDALRRVPYLSTVKLYYGSRLVWEGRVEDKNLSITGPNTTVGFTCFGYQRLLEDASLSAIWADWDVPWKPIADASHAGTFQPTMFPTDFWQGPLYTYMRAGSPANPATVIGGNNGFLCALNAGMTEDLYLTLSSNSANFSEGQIRVYTTANRSSWTLTSTVSTSGQKWITIPAGTAEIRVVWYSTINASGSTGADWYVGPLYGKEITDFIYSGASLPSGGGLTTYSTKGNVYMRDLISNYVTGLRLGRTPWFEADLVAQMANIDQFSARSRRTVLDLVDELASYEATLEWGVWEDRRFDWYFVDFDAPGWVLKPEDVEQANLDFTIDTMGSKLYVSYEDAVFGAPGEQNASATSQRNPFVKTGTTRHLVVSAPVPMTSITAQALANRLVIDNGAYPSVRATITIPADRLIENVNGNSKPAIQIRAGENVSMPWLPKTDLRAGRDGETFFHVISTAVDMDPRRRRVTLTVEGQQPTTDTLLARLANASGPALRRTK